MDIHNIYNAPIAAILLWIILGSVMGFVAENLDSGRIKKDVNGTILSGIAGSITGGVLVNILRGLPVIYLSLRGLVIALGIALLASLIQLSIAHNRNNLQRPSSA